MSKGKNETKKAKKGMVINRRNNRTINQDVRQSEPKWEHLGNGILKLKATGNKTAYIGRKGRRYVSITRKAVEIALAPKDAPES